ncbi:oxidoreductase [Actinoplanes ianthinogenes]|uniref:Oxidoreductase n=1 Tax=Actinoplanes ianthinogenes TaxID=122358 RepID=A0ABM7LPF4_9ACTN|nr:flavin reductase family protein [Actinoplanes ianthinogenes]BCJ41156.1 oxidoreductase [Actinoplanes ianthinogenes]GGR22521.1 oxidoreductase [Actinoplanes ianthinogenes]
MSTREAPSFDSKALRRAFGTFATGVTVVTVGGAAPHGMTANSFTAVSLDPPLVLVCIEHNAVMHQALRDAGQFGVSVLAAGHAPVARYFADRRRPLGGEQFVPVDWHAGEHTGAPLITGALAHFECALWRSYDGGDHTIFLGRLLGMGGGTEDDALLFHRGRLCEADRKPTEVAA